MINVFGSESDVRVWLLRELRPLHAVPVESPMQAGIPDLNCTAGWIELKFLRRWPVRTATVVRPEHFDADQRNWLTKRCASGGKAWTLLAVEDSVTLVWGTAAARYLGISWTHYDLLQQLPGLRTHWPTRPTAQQLIAALVISRWGSTP